MRLQFWKKENDFFDEIPRAKRPRETLAQTAEKIIQRRMKSDPDGYGLAAAEKIKRIAKPEEKSLLSQVKELRQIQSALRELGVGVEGEGQPGMLAGLFDRETVKAILATIIQTLSKQGQTLPQAEQQALTQPEQPQLTQETIPMPSLGELLPYLEEEPESVIAMLKERKEAGDQQAILWLNLLSKSSYRQICSLLRPVQEQNPELETLIADLLHESREKWWRQLLEGAKRAV